MIAVSLLFLSCDSEDSALIQRHGEQQAEIAKLDGELSLLQARLKNIPVDQSSELNNTIEEGEKLETELSQLKANVVSLEAEHKELTEKFEDYKRKYSIR